MENDTLKVGFVDYLERQNWWHSKEFFYDLIELNMKNYFDNHVNISVSLRKEVLGKEGRSSEKYSHDFSELGWEKDYQEIRNHITLYKEYISKHDYLFSYEASPSVLALLERENKKYCDIRISPIRFLPDVLLAVKTNDLTLAQALESATVGIEEMKKEASKIQAMYKYRIRSEHGTERKPRVIFIGQTKDDTSLYFQGRICKIEDFREEIKEDVRDRNLYYLAHPAATKEHVKYELSFLKQIAGDCEVINENSYCVLNSGENDLFIGISSGLLQEAKVFGRKSKAYIPYACPVYFSDEEIGQENNYYQIPLDVFLSKEFFSIFLFKEEKKLPILSLNQLRVNQLRFFHSAWWAYASLMAMPSQFTGELGKTLGINCILEQFHGQQNQLSKLLQREASFTEMEKNKFLIKRIMRNKKYDGYYCLVLSYLFFWSKRKREKYQKKINKLKIEIQNLKSSF